MIFVKHSDLGHAFNRNMKIMSIHLYKWSDSLVVRWQLIDQANLESKLGKAFLIYNIAFVFKFKIVLIFYVISWWALHLSFIFSRFYFHYFQGFFTLLLSAATFVVC